MLSVEDRWSVDAEPQIVPSLSSSSSSSSPGGDSGGGGSALTANKALLQTFMLIGSALSVAGSFFIILSYFLFKDSRKFSRKILLYLSFADMMASAAWALQYIVPEDAGGTGGGVPANNTRTHNLCEVQGYLLEFFYLASYIWTGCFAWHLYQLIDARNRSPRKLEALYHALSWGIPLLVSVCNIILKLLPTLVSQLPPHLNRAAVKLRRDFFSPPICIPSTNRDT